MGNTWRLAIRPSPFAMALTEPITAAALEASPAPDGEASLLSEHSADLARFHAAVAQNRRLLGDRPGTGTTGTTGTAGRGPSFRTAWGMDQIFHIVSCYEDAIFGYIWVENEYTKMLNQIFRYENHEDWVLDPSLQGPARRRAPTPPPAPRSSLRMLRQSR